MDYRPTKSIVDDEAAVADVDTVDPIAEFETEGGAPLSPGSPSTIAPGAQAAPG